VGSHLLPRLAAAFPHAEIAAPRIAALDVTDPGSVDAAMAGIRPDACVHLAAIAAIPAARRDPALAWRVNLHGALAVAEAILRHVPDCALIYPGSADAYGRSFRAGIAVDERMPQSPLNTYGATKAAAEMALVALVAEGLRVIALRPFNHTGPGQTGDFVVPAFARQVAAIAAGLQPPVMRVGALEPRRDFLDVRDVCDAYAAAIARAPDIAPGSIFNIASGTARRIGDILDALLALAGIRATVETSTSLLRPTDIACALGDAGAARAALAWSPRIAWEITLRDVLEDWRVRVAA
jgi:GDP-4-dehydro-6-deoxy-D-mannose reductase